MKKSKYNLFFKESDISLAFNSMTCALAQVDEEFYRIYNDIENVDAKSLSEKDNKLIKDMLKGGYIIADDCDELKSIKFRNSVGKYNKDFLSLVIAPTLECNFACPYCYENPKQGIMSKEVQDKLVEIIKKNAERKRILTREKNETQNINHAADARRFAHHDHGKRYGFVCGHRYVGNREFYKECFEKL